MKEHYRKIDKVSGIINTIPDLFTYQISFYPKGVASCLCIPFSQRPLNKGVESLHPPSNSSDSSIGFSKPLNIPSLLSRTTDSWSSD